VTIIHSAQLGDREYHRTPGITFHRLKDFLTKGPSYYEARYVTGTMPPPPDSDWGLLGQAYHAFGLEGEEVFRQQFVAAPPTYMGKEGKAKDAPLIEKPWNWNATFCQEWREAQRSGGKRVLDAADYDAAVAIGRNMRANPHAARLLGCGWCELTITQPEPRFPVPIMGRIDWLASTSTKTSDAWAIADPKGCTDIHDFERESIRLGYHRQMAWYRKLVRDEIGKQLPVFLIALEKGCMHRVRPYQVDPALLDMAEEQNARDLDKLADAYQRNHWPLDHDEGMRVLMAPAWMTKRDDALPEVAPWEAGT